MRIDLGLSDDEFQMLTMRQFVEMRKRIEEQELRRDLRFGIVASTVANSAFGREGEAVTPKDLFPALAKWDREEEMAAEEMLAFIETFRASRKKPSN